jgi:hypothetical protein
MAISSVLASTRWGPSSFVSLQAVIKMLLIIDYLHLLMCVLAAAENSGHVRLKTQEANNFGRIDSEFLFKQNNEESIFPKLFDQPINSSCLHLD